MTAHDGCMRSSAQPAVRSGRRGRICAAVLVILAGACSTDGVESDAVFEPFPGLECPTGAYFGEDRSNDPDVASFATPVAAIEASLDLWKHRVGGEVVVIEEGTELVYGARIVDGRRVLLTFPELTPAGGWVTLSIVGCEAYAG